MQPVNNKITAYKIFWAFSVIYLNFYVNLKSFLNSKVNVERWANNLIDTSTRKIYDGKDIHAKLLNANWSLTKCY